MDSKLLLTVHDTLSCLNKAESELRRVKWEVEDLKRETTALCFLEPELQSFLKVDFAALRKGFPQ